MRFNRCQFKHKTYIHSNIEQIHCMVNFRIPVVNLLWYIRKSVGRTGFEPVTSTLSR
jgi:hypothetical protein